MALIMPSSPAERKKELPVSLIRCAYAQGHNLRFNVLMKSELFR
jgi:hypothetical protein